jgi:hypothetical protein
LGCSSKQAANLKKVGEYNKLTKKENCYLYLKLYPSKWGGRNYVKISESRLHNPNSNTGCILVPKISIIICMGSGHLKN